jgi:hypothetical protein
MDAIAYAECGTCGYQMMGPAEGTVAICMCRVPDDILQFEAFVSKGPGYTTCPRCRSRLQFDIPSGYIAEDDACLHLFAPASTELDLRALSDALSRGKQRPLKVERMADGATWRRNLIRAACEPHMQLLNLLTSDFSQEVLQRCVDESGLFGKGFQMALYCFLNGLVDTRIAAVGSEEARRFQGRTFLPIGEASAMIKLDENPAWFEAVRERATMALTFALIATANHKWTTAFGEVIARPALLTELTLRSLGEAIGGHLDVLLGAYDMGTYDGCRTVAAFEAMHARQYLDMPIANPRRNQWAAAYARYQLFLTAAGGSTPETEVPLSFARTTLSFREVYDQVMALADVGPDGVKSISASMYGLLREFDADAAAQALPIRFKGGMNSAEKLRKAELEALAPLACLLVDAVATTDEVLELGNLAWRKLVDAGRIEDAVVVVVHITHKLSNTGRNPHSLAFLASFTVEVGAEAMSTWPAQEQFAVFTELANCRRYAGDPLGAREAYERGGQLLGDDLRNNLVRMNRRNLAIVLRESGEGERSLEMLAQLLPFASGEERVHIESSIMVAYAGWGHRHEALACARRIAAHAGLSWGKVNLRAVAQSVGSVLLLDGTGAERELALSIMEEVYKCSATDGDVINRGIVAYQLYASPVRERYAPGQFEADLAALLSAVADPSSPKSLQAPLVVEMLLEHPERFVQGGANMRTVLENFVEQWGSSTNWRVGLAWQELAGLRGRAGDWDGATDAMSEALDAMVRLAVTIDPQGDPFHVLASLRSIPAMAAGIALDSMEDSGPEFAMAVADLGSSLVLSCRMSERAGFGLREFDDLVQRMDADQIGALVVPGTTVVQVLGYDPVTLLAISRSEGGALSYRVHGCPLDRNAWDALSQRLQFVLGRARLTDKRDPLAAVPGWPPFAQWLEAFMRSLECGTLLWISGALSTTPVALASPSGLRLSFCPSMTGAVALSALARGHGIAAGWRPARVFDAAVWRHGDAAANVDAIRAASDRWREACASNGAAYERAMESRADAARIVDGLGRCDMARLACHGRASPESFSSSFLVASDNNLPPSAILPRHGQALEPYLLEWKQLSRLAPAPALVVSTACDTGQAIYSHSDERLGLERAFLLAGSLLYVAPQWPVPMRQVQDDAAHLFERWIAKPDATICGTLADLAAKQEEAGMPRWIARSLASFGLTSL